jgi:hypothetical protein
MLRFRRRCRERHRGSRLEVGCSVLRGDEMNEIMTGKGGRFGDIVERTMCMEPYLDRDEGEAQSGEKICAWKTPLGHLALGGMRSVLYWDLRLGRRDSFSR